MIRPYRSAALTGFLSLCSPGLGQIYLGELGKGMAFSGTVGVGVALFKHHHHTAMKQFGVQLCSTAWSYGVYSAYRDARLFNRESLYSYKMPTDRFVDLAAAPFRWSVIKKPEVWGAFLGSLALATTVTYLAYPSEARIKTHSVSLAKWAQPLSAFAVGLSEESFFRGYLQSQIAEISNPTTGIVLSSLIFGAAHMPNVLVLDLPHEHRWRYFAFSIPMITALGGYFGWMTHKNRSLKESVALHSWYDFTLFTIGAIGAQAAIGGPVNVGYSFAF